MRVIFCNMKYLFYKMCQLSRNCRNCRLPMPYHPEVRSANCPKLCANRHISRHSQFNPRIQFAHISNWINTRLLELLPTQLWLNVLKLS